MNDQHEPEAEEEPRELDRMEQVETMLAACTRTTTIQRVLAAEWGITRRQVRNYIKAVRDKWAAEAAVLVDGADRTAYRAQIREGLLDATNAAARSNDVNQWLRGLTLLAQLDGLNAPTRTEVSGPNGKPIEQTLRAVALPADVVDELAAEPLRLALESETAQED